MSTQLAPVLRTAGYALAHAVGSIRFGGTLCTLAIREAGGTRTVYRYAARSIVESLAAAHGHLAQQVDAGAHAALVYDGYVTSADHGRSDALIVELLGPHGAPLGRIAQRYRPARRLGIPLIGRTCAVRGTPIIEESVDCDDSETQIYRGVREHPFGTRLFGLPTE
jgi:hypothetical protein